MKSINLAAIDLNLLVAFEALLEQQSVTKAAEQLQIGQLALRLATVCNLTVFELPVKTKPWMVSMLWSTWSDQDEANRWLRNTIKSVSQKLETS